MTMELAERVAHLPETFDHSEKSTAALLREAGFPQAEADLEVEEVQAVLEKEPDLARLWLQRGHDQRAARGWGIEHADRNYRLVRFADGRSVPLRDRLRACAEFAVRYVRTISDVMARDALARR
jgi:hypothetical protein